MESNQIAEGILLYLIASLTAVREPAAIFVYNDIWLRVLWMLPAPVVNHHTHHTGKLHELALNNMLFLQLIYQSI